MNSEDLIIDELCNEWYNKITAGLLISINRKSEWYVKLQEELDNNVLLTEYEMYKN